MIFCDSFTRCSCLGRVAPERSLASLSINGPSRRPSGWLALPVVSVSVCFYAGVRCMLLVPRRPCSLMTAATTPQRLLLIWHPHPPSPPTAVHLHGPIGSSQPVEPRPFSIAPCSFMHALVQLLWTRMQIDRDGESVFIIHSIGGTVRRSTAGLPPRGQFDITGAREPKALQVAAGFTQEGHHCRATRRPHSCQCGCSERKTHGCDFCKAGTRDRWVYSQDAKRFYRCRQGRVDYYATITNAIVSSPPAEACAPIHCVKYTVCLSNEGLAIMLHEILSPVPFYSLLIARLLCSSTSVFVY